MEQQHYADSDHNHLESSTFAATQTLGSFLTTYNVVSALTSDREGSARSSTGSILLHRDLGEELSFDVALGNFRTSAGDNLIGSIDSALNRDDLSVTGQIARSTIDTLTAQALRLNLRQTDFSLDVSDSLLENLTADLEAHHLLYTDGNRANQLNLTSKYELDDVPGKLSIGYQFSYAAFAMSVNDGYWSPQLLLSHEALLQWAYGWRNFYTKLELSGGYQTVVSTNHGSAANVDNYGGSSGYDVSASAAVGVHPSPNTIIEYALSDEQSVGWSSASSVMNFRFDF